SLRAPTLQVLVMLASIPVVMWTAKSAKRYDLGKVRIGLVLATLFNAAFVAIRMVELLVSLNVKWDANAYASAQRLILGAHAAFAAHLQIAYNLVPYACVRRGGEILIHVVGVLSVVLALIGAIVAWRVWLSAGREVPGEDGGSLPRTRFMGAVGLGTSSML